MAVCPFFLVVVQATQMCTNVQRSKQLFFSIWTLTNVGGYLEETSNLFAGVRLLENDFQNTVD